MRRIVFQMMTTLNGRLDDPMAWLSGVDGEQYRAIDDFYTGYDTVLVGRTTYEEMAAYWPGALEEGTETNRRMAGRMRDYRKLVFSRSSKHEIAPWANTEQVAVADDAELATCLTALKAEAGADIHLSGEASFAQAVIGLGLVDEFRFFVYPAVSQGAPWFAALDKKLDLKLVDCTAFENGVVGLTYLPIKIAERSRPDSFTELLT